MIRVLLITIFLQGCTVYGGFSVHDGYKGARDAYNVPNPLGRIGVRSEPVDWLWDIKFYVEHESSLFYTEEGGGFNKMGISKDLYTFQLQ